MLSISLSLSFSLSLSPSPPLSLPPCFAYRYYWYTSALQATGDINVAARFNWQMWLCLLLAWVVVYLCLFKGIQSSGKVG